MENKIAVKERTWSEVRDKVRKVNPQIADIIDEISPDDSFTLIQAKYPYGSEIIKNGEFFLPSQHGALIPFLSNAVDNSLKEKLNYVKGTNPMMLVLNNSMELFIPLEDRIVPFSLAGPGDILGVWGFIENFKHNFLFYTPIPLWGLTAGARSVFMLPKIGELSAFYKVKKQLALKHDMPKTLLQHWRLFKEIANNPEFKQEWNIELLFFSNKWIEISRDPIWHRFKSYIFEKSWGGSEFWRNQFCWDLTFTHIQTKRHMKPCPYAADIANHLLSMSVGAVPGFRPFLNNQAMPVDGIKNIFEEIYGIRYSPIIIGPENFSVFNNDQRPIYYSFNYPTSMRLSPKASQRSSTVTDLYGIRLLIERYLEEILNSNLRIDGTALYEMAKLAKFEFCHNTSDEINKMTCPNEIMSNDISFKEANLQCQTTELPKNAPFLNGAIQISKR